MGVERGVLNDDVVLDEGVNNEGGNGGEGLIVL